MILYLFVTFCIGYNMALEEALGNTSKGNTEKTVVGAIASVIVVPLHIGALIYKSLND